MERLNFNIRRVMAVLLRALDHIDVRLVDHGHRVAYIVYKMMQASGKHSEREMQEVVIISALHDIGAYKTEEIGNMMNFESNDVFDHSIYGYLFLKYMSPLGKWADLILYHHINYALYDKLKIDKKIGSIASMIHLADRMDVMLKNQECLLEQDHDYLALRFGEEAISIYAKANEQFKVEENIRNGAYLWEIDTMLKYADFDRNILIEFIKMVAYSIDFRSETTVSHVITTVTIAMELGRMLQLDDLELKKIELGAYLHDIGKIATPLEILEKPGSLTNEEMKIMRGHIEITGEILRGRVHDEIYQIAYRHHEKMDGWGYPLKLSGKDLTLNDKIVAVSDMMSALTGKRSYKESFSKEVVVGILERQRDGGKLDRQVIDTAIGNYDEIMECCSKNILIITEIYHTIKNEFVEIQGRLREVK